MLNDAQQRMEVSAEKDQTCKQTQIRGHLKEVAMHPSRAAPAFAERRFNNGVHSFERPVFAILCAVSKWSSLQGPKAGNYSLIGLRYELIATDGNDYDHQRDGQPMLFHSQNTGSCCLNQQHEP